MNSADVVGLLACACTVLVWLTCVPVCWRIIKNGNSSNVSFFPFIVMFCNATLWFKYGLLKHDMTVTYVNGIGAVLTMSYMMIYYMYTSIKTLLHRQLAFGGLLLFPVLSYLRFVATDRDEALSHLGLFCAMVGVLSYGSPLAAMSDVLRTKSTSSMTFSLSFGNFIVALEWIIYGHLVHDLFIQVPNFLGFLLGFVQLCLFVKYPSRPASLSSATTASDV